ncbi:MAG: hypothetical protein ACRBCI_08790 [Cellvibrionaceae bacterium]
MSKLLQKDQTLHSVDNLTDSKKHITHILKLGKQEVSLFSRNLNPQLFNNQNIIDYISLIARQSHLVDIRILIEDPQAIIDSNHQLLKLIQRLPSKIKIQRILIKPPESFEFMIVDNNKLWLQHQYTAYNGIIYYNSPSNAKKHKEIFNTLWKQSEECTKLRRLLL